jgi:hypothetical protein
MSSIFKAQPKVQLENNQIIVGFEILTMMMINSKVFWVLMSCSSDKFQHFRGTYRLHHQGQRASQARNQQEAACWAFFELHGITTQKTVFFNK